MTLADRPDGAPVRSREEVFSGRVWDVVRDVVDLPGGSTVVREIVAHPGAVAVAALDDQGQLLVIQQYRHPIGTYEWELPAGLLDVPGEDPLEAARRELFEEGDLTAAHWEHLLRYATSRGSGMSARTKRPECRPAGWRSTRSLRQSRTVTCTTAPCC